MGRVEVDMLEKALQRLVASLHIADGIRRHTEESTLGWNAPQDINLSGEVWALRVFCFDLATEPAASGEGAGDCGPYGTAGFDNIVEDSVDGIFVEDAEIPVGVDVHFERFQLKTFFIRHVVQCNGPEVRQVSFWTNRCVLGDLNRNFISLILIREGLDIWERSVDSTSRMTLVVPQFRGFGVSSARFTFHVSRLTSSTLASSIQSDRFFPIRYTERPRDISFRDRLHTGHLYGPLHRGHVP